MKWLYWNFKTITYMLLKKNHCCNIDYKNFAISDSSQQWFYFFFAKWGYIFEEKTSSTLLKIELCTITRMTKPWVKLTKIFFSYQFQNHSSSIYKIFFSKSASLAKKNDPIKKVFHMKHLDIPIKIFFVYLRTNSFNLWIFYKTVH